MKTSTKSLGVLAAVAIAFVASNAYAATLAQWSFDVSPPSTAGPLSADSGSGTGIALHASSGAVYSAPAGNGTPNSWSANAWQVGDYFQFSTSTVGFFDVIVSWSQGGSSTGPKEFLFQYSTDGTTFTTFGSQYNVALSGFAAGTVNTTFQFTNDLSSVTDLNGVSTAYFRMMQNTTNTIGGGAAAAGGTGRVDTVIISATAVPEPATFLLAAIGLGLTGLVGRRRFRR